MLKFTTLISKKKMLFLEISHSKSQIGFCKTAQKCFNQQVFPQSPNQTNNHGFINGIPTMRFQLTLFVITHRRSHAQSSRRFVHIISTIKCRYCDRCVYIDNLMERA